MRAEGFAGWDRTTRSSRRCSGFPGLRRSSTARFAVQQVGAPLAGQRAAAARDPEGCQPVTLGLVLEAYAALGEERLREDASALVGRLRALVTPGFSGACWGYDFPWQSRSTLIPAYSPTVVATAFVTNGSSPLTSGSGSTRRSSSARARPGRAPRSQPHRRPGGTFCWSYSPLDTQAVLNATAKGSRLCAQVWSVNGDEQLAAAARASVPICRGAPARGRGLAVRGRGPAHVVDNFHTGYVLDALDEWRRRTGDAELDGAIERGWRYYRANLFEPNGVPAVLRQQAPPDRRDRLRQALLTLSRSATGRRRSTWRAGWWIASSARTERSATARYSLGRNSIPYMRWSTAWIFGGLTRVLSGEA